MNRLFLALAAAGALAACDSAPYPEPSNPFDPAFPDDRRVSAPTALEVASADPTSVTLEWDDPSSFEAGFRVEVAVLEGVAAEGGGAPPFVALATLPPNTTRYTDTGLVGTADRLYRVLAIGGATGDAPSPTRRVVYPTPDQIRTDALGFVRTSVVTRDGGAFVAVGTGSGLVAMRYGVGGPVAVSVPVPDYDVAGTFGAAGVVVARARPFEVATYAVLEGASAVRSGTLEQSYNFFGQYVSPRFLGETAVSSDGRTLVAQGRTTDSLAVWDLTTGRRLDSGLGPSPDWLVGLGRGGVLVTADLGASVLRGLEVATGAVRWVRALEVAPLDSPVYARDGVEAAVWDSAADRVLVPSGAGYAVLEGATGAVVARFDLEGVPAIAGRPLALRDGLAVVGGPRLDLGGTNSPLTAPYVCAVVDWRTGAVVRAATVGQALSVQSPVPAAPFAGLSGEALTVVTVDAVLRYPLRGVWRGV